jgi:outer membrane protein assembly factor BamB
MMTVRRSVLAAAFLPLLCASQGLAQDWPQWRGANRDAHVTGFQPPATWPKELAEKWKVKVGNGVATPALVGDKLYVFTREGDDEITRCLDANSGKQIWEDKYKAAPVTGPANRFPGPRSSPTVLEGKVVTLGAAGVLSCLDAATGKVVWRKDEIKGAPRFFASSSPLVVDGVCIAQLGTDNKGGIAAYELATGKDKWTWTGQGPAYASPSLMTVDGAKLVIAMTASKMVALDAADGKLVWEAPFAVTGRGYNASTPVIDGQTLIYDGSARGATAVKFEKSGDKVTAKELWKNQDAAVSVMYNTPVIKDGLLYGLSASNDLFCINMQTGKTAWTAPFGAAAAAGAGKATAGGGAQKGKGKGGGGMRPDVGYGSIVDAGPVLFALTPSAQLVVFKPSDKDFMEQARIKLPATLTYAYPIVAGNRLFVKDDESVELLTIQ